MSRRRTTLAAAGLTVAVIAAILASTADAAGPVGFLRVVPDTGSITTTRVGIAAPVSCLPDTGGLHIRVTGDSFPTPYGTITDLAIPQSLTVDGYWPLDIGTWAEIADRAGATLPLTGSARISVGCFTINGPDAGGSFISVAIPFKGDTFGDPCHGFPDCPGLPTPQSPPPTATPEPSPTATPTPAPTATPVPLVVRKPLTKRQAAKCRTIARWYAVHGWPPPSCRWR